jgi:hypothetical protein
MVGSFNPRIVEHLIGSLNELAGCAIAKGRKYELETAFFSVRPIFGRSRTMF